jgi:mannose-6-phosphate isomerase
MNELYPLKFKPIPREMIWGGNRLRKLFNKPFPAESRIGESWEISAYDDYISIVSNGHLKGNTILELVEVYMGDLVGEKIYDRFGVWFPLLIKLIDAAEVLSIQVHPGDELSLRRHNANGKTEMWYVLEAEPGAELISGFSMEVSPGLFLEKLNSGKLLDILNVEKVKPGDVFFMPAGRVHAIGKGIVLAEIQQTSDLTYRIYDWDRKDAEGNARELHVDLAMDAIDFGYYSDYKTFVEEIPNMPVLLAECKYFTTQRLDFDSDLNRDYNLLDSFVICMCTKGDFILDWGKGSMEIQKGETVLIPAFIEEVSLSCKVPSGLLEIFVK